MRINLLIYRVICCTALFLATLFARTTHSQSPVIKGLLEGTSITIQPNSVLFVANKNKQSQVGDLNETMNIYQVSYLLLEQQLFEISLIQNSEYSTLQFEVPYLTTLPVFSSISTGNTTVDAMNSIFWINESVIKWINESIHSITGCLQEKSEEEKVFFRREKGGIDISSCPYIKTFPYEIGFHDLKFDTDQQRLELSFSFGNSLVVNLPPTDGNTSQLIFARNMKLGDIHQAPKEKKRRRSQLLPRSISSGLPNPPRQQHNEQKHTVKVSGSSAAATGAADGDDDREECLKKQKLLEMILQRIKGILQISPEGKTLNELCTTLEGEGVGSGKTLKRNIRTVLASNRGVFTTPELAAKNSEKTWFLK